MNKELLKLIQDKKLSPITDLNEVPQSLIEEARKVIPKISKVRFFMYLVIPSDQDYIPHFVNDCVEKSNSPKTWLRGRILMPSTSLEDQLTKTRDEILSGINDQVTHYLPAEYEGWKQGCSFEGAPVKLEQDSTYRSLVPKGMAAMSIQKIIPIAQVNNTAMYRRWIAQRIARCIDLHKIALKPDEILKKTRELVPEKKWNDDVHFALKGLSAEAQQGLIKEGVVPGFILPDEFYL